MRRRTEGGDLPIDIEREGVPIHRALYDALREAILAGRLRRGAHVPSSRDLAAQLGISRGTVVAVYEQLQSEGYLGAKTGSGTTVADDLPDRWFSPVPTKTKTATAPKPERRTALSRWSRSSARSPFDTAPRKNARPFRPHVPAVDMFPIDVWGRLAAKRARTDEALLLGDPDVRGYAPLREALAEHLRVARGVVCTADQLVIVSSGQQAIDLVARLTLDPDSEVWIEDPGYRGARSIFEMIGAKLVPVPVDDEGLDVSAGIRRAPGASLAYVTPGRQSPLGMTMTIERRLALLAWASASGAVVFEDDYDSEYRYEGRPVPALQGLDRSGVVVHAGTFSKTLLPSLRLAYVVVPDPLLDRFVEAKSIVDRYTAPHAQAVLADFIEGGHFGRHLRKMRELYAERRAALVTAIEDELGDEVTISGASAGLDLVLRLPEGADDRALRAALEAASIEALALSPHALGRRGPPGLVLGFAAYSPARLRRSVAALRAVLTTKK